MKVDKNIYAAIAMALYEYQGNNVHDKEPGFITIQPRQTMWNAKFLRLTAKPSIQGNERIQIYNRRTGI